MILHAALRLRQHMLMWRPYHIQGVDVTSIPYTGCWCDVYTIYTVLKKVLPFPMFFSAQLARCLTKLLSTTPVPADARPVTSPQQSLCAIPMHVNATHRPSSHTRQQSVKNSWLHSKILISFLTACPAQPAPSLQPVARHTVSLCQRIHLLREKKVLTISLAKPARKNAEVWLPDDGSCRRSPLYLIGKKVLLV